MLKKLLWILLSLAFSCLLNGQNLLSNGGFEDINFCHKYDENCSPKAWRSTTPKLFGYHKTETERFISLLLMNKARSNDRKFAQTQLLCPLEAGKRYAISLRLRPNQFRIGSFGVLFKTNFSTSNEGLIARDTTSFINIPMPPESNEHEWIEVSQQFVAKGDEAFLILGNFRADNATKVGYYNPKAYKKKNKYYDANRMRVTYTFDDLQLICLDSTSLCDTTSTHALLYTDSIRHSMHRLYPPESITTSMDTTKLDSLPSLATTASPSPAIPPKKIVLRNLNYASNAWQITANDVPELAPLIEYMQTTPNVHITITGYTDNIGSEAANLALSRNRAESVYNYLIAKGITAEYMQFEGKGEANPVGDNTTEAGRALNRWVELLLNH